MFVLKSLTNDDAQCRCDIKAFAEKGAAVSEMRKEYDSIRNSYGIEDGTESVANTALFYEKEDAAEVNSGINQYSWEIVEFKGFFARYQVQFTSDAFEDPDDVYYIWDVLYDKYCVDCDGRALTFREEWQAQDFIDHYADKIFA